MGAIPYSRYVLGSLPWYSTLIVLGMALTLWLCLREEKRLGLPKDTIIDLALYVIPCGVIGARLYYVAFSWPTFANDPWSVLRIWEGGLAIYGAVIGGLLAMAVFSRVRHIPLAQLTDMIVPGLALSQALGRWGNYFNMEAYGEVITNPTWQFFPAGVLIPENGTLIWHMATFFYESLWNLLVFVLLMTLRKRTYRRFDLSCWYLLLYGAGRFVIEGLRMDSLMRGPFRVSQLLSAGMCLFALGRFTLLAHKKHAVWMIVPAAACLIVAALVPLSSTLRHLLMAALALVTGALLYPQTRPEEQTSCPPHP